MEVIYFAVALVIMTALIYGGLHRRYRNRIATRKADQMVRDRYERHGS
jgi:hypothetical protein